MLVVCRLNIVWSVSGENLDNNHLVFTIKKLIYSFKRDFPLLFDYDFNKFGRPKEYLSEELLGLIVYGSFHNKYNCRALADWVFNNDESVNYILNNKAPKKSTISSFLQESNGFNWMLFSNI